MLHGVGCMKNSGLYFQGSEKGVFVCVCVHMCICLCVQLALEQHGFEVCRSTSMWIFFNKCGTVL